MCAVKLYHSADTMPTREISRHEAEDDNRLTEDYDDKSTREVN